MLKLFVKDNTNGCVHEYGTNPHDALILQEDGSLHYENLQCCTGTMFPEEGFSFCLEDGTDPRTFRDIDYRNEPYIDIGGCVYDNADKAGKPTNADRIRAMSDEELAHLLIQYDNEWDHYISHIGSHDDYENALAAEVEWLQQPAEGE